jgi:hypothetical protein
MKRLLAVILLTGCTQAVEQPSPAGQPAIQSQQATSNNAFANQGLPTPPYAPAGQPNGGFVNPQPAGYSPERRPRCRGWPSWRVRQRSGELGQLLYVCPHINQGTSS